MKRLVASVRKNAAENHDLEKWGQNPFDGSGQASGASRSFSEMSLDPPVDEDTLNKLVEGAGAGFKPVTKPLSPAYDPNPSNSIIMANYFKVTTKENWFLYQYHVTFSPEVEMASRRKGIIRKLKENVDKMAYIFDGTILITPLLLVTGNASDSQSTYVVLDEKENQLYDVTLKLVNKSARHDKEYQQVYNLIIRKCMFAVGLEEVGRNFYDRNCKIDFPKFKLQLWPGYVTSIREYDEEILLCVEVIHRVLRMENLLSIINAMSKSRDFRKVAATEIKHSIVMTHYNKKNYRVDEIDWHANPTQTFEAKGQKITFVDYYKKAYGEEITDLTQPLLVCRPTKKDIHRGALNNILLVPEMCQITGLSESMRANMPLMKEIAGHLHMAPELRAKSVQNFVMRLVTSEMAIKCLTEWGMTIDTELIRCPYNMLKKETILFADGTMETNAQADWTMAFRSRKLLKVNELKNWVIITPSKEHDAVQNLIKTMVKVSSALNFTIHRPKSIIQIDDTRIPTYLKALAKIALPVDLIFIILPTKALEPYTSIKRYLSVDIGVPSQGFVAKNLHSKGIMSIVTKVVVQINAKLGGEPWAVRIPLKDIMVCGFDVQKCGNGVTNIGALIASNSPSLGSFFSYTTQFTNAVELSEGIVVGVKNAIENYFSINKAYPERIIMFRDSISEGQEDVVLQAEAKVLVNSFTKFYVTRQIVPPKFAYIVVNRKCNTRLFTMNRDTLKVGNPDPGTVVHEKITTYEMPSFFIVAQVARQGSVSPCFYKILYDTTKLSKDKLQSLCYKLCHLYYNWSGTVGVPAPCQYSRKLAFQTASIFGGDRPQKKLENSLHFL